ALRGASCSLGLLRSTERRWGGDSRIGRTDAGVCLRGNALLRAAHLTPHRPQNSTEEQIQQRQQCVLENAEERLGGGCDHVASKRRCVLPTLTMSPSAN